MKYQLKRPNPKDMQHYKEICIDCGKERIKSWPKGVPLPNTPELIEGTTGWFSCHIFNQHNYYTEYELEPV